MSQPRVLITGATGFVGSRLCEGMALTGGFVPRELVHSTGGPGRTARFPSDFVIGNVCDSRSVREAMKGCDLVVHLARGSDQVLKRGLETVLNAAQRQGVHRLIHLSSVAVYGDRPGPDCCTED